MISSIRRERSDTKIYISDIACKESLPKNTKKCVVFGDIVTMVILCSFVKIKRI